MLETGFVSLTTAKEARRSCGPFSPAPFSLLAEFYLVKQALGRWLSDLHPLPQEGETLEPKHQGFRFLGISKNWPGLVIIILGALLLLLGGYF